MKHKIESKKWPRCEVQCVLAKFPIYWVFSQRVEIGWFSRIYYQCGFRGNGGVEKRKFESERWSQKNQQPRCLTDAITHSPNIFLLSFIIMIISRLNLWFIWLMSVFFSDSGGFYCLLFIFFSVWSFLVLGFLGSDLRLGYFLEFVLFFSDEKVGEWKRKKMKTWIRKLDQKLHWIFLEFEFWLNLPPFFWDILVTDFKFGCFSWIYPLVGCWENGEKKRQRAEISPVLMLLGRGLTLGDFLESILCLLAEEMEVKKMKMKIRIWKMTGKWS